MGGFAITHMVKKNRGGGNIPNIFMGIKNFIANIFEALGSFICFVDVVPFLRACNLSTFRLWSTWLTTSSLPITSKLLTHVILFCMWATSPHWELACF